MEAGRATPHIAGGTRSVLSGCQRPSNHIFMLSYTVLFLIIAIIAGALGFGAVAGMAATFAKILFVVFLVLFVVSLLRGRKV